VRRTKKDKRTKLSQWCVGFSFQGSGQNNGIGLFKIKRLDERPGAEQSVQAVASPAAWEHYRS